MGCGSSSSSSAKPKEPKPLYSPPKDFPTPKLLAQCQRELADLDTSSAQEVDQDGFPQPFPPKLIKADFFERDRLSLVREHALKAPKDLPLKPLPQVAQYLNNNNEYDDLQRLYAAFSWLVYTSRTLHRNQLEPTPLKETLLHRLVLAHAGYVKYNDIFSDICKELGLTVKPIQGKVKQITQNLVTSEDGMWLAVLLNTSWRLVDVDFAVTTIKNKQHQNNGKLGRRGQNHPTLDIPFYKDVEFYFLSDPEQFVFSHFTEDIAWQMLARPVTYDEFKVMAHLTEGFFTMGFIDVHQAKGVLESDNGRMELTCSLPEDNYVRLSSTLQKIAGRSVLQTIKGEKLDNLVEITNTGHNKRIKITLVDIGRHILKVWAQDVSSDNNVQSADVVGVWFIDSQKPTFVSNPNPKSELREFGPGADLRLLGIELEYLPISLGLKHIFFRCNKKMYDFRYSVETNHDAKPGLKEFMVHYSTPNKGSGVILKCLTIGKYVLNVFVKEKLSHQEFKCSCCLLFHITSSYLDDTPLAEERNTRIGHMVDTVTNASKPSSDLRAVSHSIPFIQSSNGQPVCILLESTKSHRLMFQYRVQSSLAIKDVSNYIWYNVEEQVDGMVRIKLTARLPQVGIYTLSVFALIVGRKSDTFREIYRYLISAQKHQKECIPFPEPLPDWQPQYTLVCPQEGLLKEQEESDFSLEVNHADNINICHNKSSLYQTLNSSEGGTFSGKVKSMNGGNHLIVTASLETTTEEVQLLKYTVLKNDAWLKLQDEHAKMEEISQNRQQYLMQLLEQEKALVEQLKKKTQEAEKELAEQFEDEKAELIEREKQWQKEFEEYFTQETDRMAGRHIGNLGEQEQTRVVQREIQKILQGQMLETETRKKLYKGLSEDILRQRLRRAILTRDRKDLQRAIDDYYNSQLPAKGNRDLFVAERLLEMAILRDELVNSTLRRDVHTAAELLHEIRKRNFQDSLEKEVFEAENMIQSMQQVNDFKDYILNMDKRMMSELRSYQKPPKGVHHVMKAVFLLLGEDEDTTAEWSSCATMCIPYGVTGLNRRIKSLHMDSLHPEIVARAKQLLVGFRFEQVQHVSSGAGLFFMWAKGCVEEYEQTDQEDSNSSFLDNVQPAGVNRQKELLGKLPLQWNAAPPNMEADWIKVPPPGRTSQEFLSPQVSSRTSSLNPGQTTYRSNGFSNGQLAGKPKYQSKYGFMDPEDSQD